MGRSGQGEPAARLRKAFPSRTAQHALKREALLREAASAFNRRGFHATSLEEIARNLGITKAALYYYFENKHAVLYACFVSAMDAAFRSMKRARQTGRTGREKLRLTLQGYLEELIDELSCCVALIEENALLPDAHAEIIRQRDLLERDVRALIREGIADGSIAPVDPKLAAFAIFGAINWLPKWFRPDGKWSSKEVSAALAELLERALSTAPIPALVVDHRGPAGKRRGATPRR